MIAAKGTLMGEKREPNYLLTDRGEVRPVIIVRDAGRGETPAVPNAKFKRGDVVKVRNTKALAHFPREAVVAVAVPPNFPPDYALADLMCEPRPLMHQSGKRTITYILVNEGDLTPYLANEKDLLESGKPPVEVGSFSRAPAGASHD